MLSDGAADAGGWGTEVLLGAREVALIAREHTTDRLLEGCGATCSTRHSSAQAGLINIVFGTDSCIRGCTILYIKDEPTDEKKQKEILTNYSSPQIVERFFPKKPKRN